MKKKIINGILMVALVGATSTSFVSCKDTSEDVKTDLMAQVNAVKANLEPRVQQAENDIDALEGRMSTAEGDITTLKGDVTGLKSDVTSLKNRVSTLEDEKDSLAQVTKTIEGQLTQVESKINTIVESLKNMVTSVTVNATSTSILDNSKLFPGLNLQFLGTAMGKATTTGKFPSTTTMANHGTKLEAADFAGVEQYSWSNGDILPKANEETELADAGTVWFTLNPSNVDVKNLKALRLVDSQGNASFVTINKNDVVKDEESVLTWGITRADEFKPVLWKAQAGIDLEATDLATIAPAEIIDYKAVAADVRALVSQAKAAAKAANRNNYDELAKATTKGLLKGSAQIVASLLQTKVPNLPALALEAQWEDTVGVRSVLSDYSIAATAYKPLSFDFGKDLVDGRQVSLDKIDRLVARVLNKIANKVNSIGINNITIANINLTAAELAQFSTSTKIAVWVQPGVGNESNIVITTNDTTAPDAVHTTLKTSTTVTADVTAAVNTLLNEVNGSLNGANADITSIINEIKSLQANVTSYADRTKNFEVRVSDFLEREINRVITKVADDGLTRILEPVILFQAGENYNVTRFFDGQIIPAGKITLVPTTVTNELFAPAFKKYVAVKAADGSFAVQKLMTKGDKDFKKIEANLKAGEYTVIYSALDFYGNQVSKKYNVTVK
jgi:predicted nuclease with TOPRIM domain